MQRQARKGIYIPKTVYPLLIEGAHNVISGAPHDAGTPHDAGAGHDAGADSPIFADFKRRIAGLDLGADAKSELIEEARAALVRELQPAYEQLIQLLKTQARRTPITGGCGSCPKAMPFTPF